MMTWQFDFLAGVAIFSLALSFYHRRRPDPSTAVLPLPPGPKQLPLIGNMLDIPKTFWWMTYHKWCQEFDSDIIHLNAAGTSLIVLDSAEAATELLEKRSSIYSSRARTPMLSELMGFGFNFGFMPYGDQWRHHRRLMHQNFHPTAAMRFHSLELKAAHGLLRHLLEEPDTFQHHVRQMTGEAVITITYGLDVLPKDDPFITVAEAGAHALESAAVPGAFLVDTLPWLKYVPAWMPFAGFKRRAKECRKVALTMLEMPFAAGKQKIASGDFTPSFMSYSLEQMNGGHDLARQESAIQAVAGSMYLAGSDTLLAAITSCVLGLVKHPEVLKKAHGEIDAVIGNGQLPNFDDRDSLPYITAIVKETLRWRDVTPIAIPHLLTVDDTYKGYRLPAGSIVIPNAWAMLHNDAVYPKPFTFNPERFMKDGKLDPTVRDPGQAAFGFGRRVCPGRYMAFSIVWIAVASLIAVFDITKAVDENGQVIEPSEEYLGALVIMPPPFQCSIKPRSREAEALVRATANLSYY